MNEFGTIESAPPDPNDESSLGVIECTSGGCLNKHLDYRLGAVKDEELKKELKAGKTGQDVEFELGLGGTTARNIKKK